ncbi:MAG: LEA type 2 family protein [Longimicrobiales bacterium]
MTVIQRIEVSTRMRTALGLFLSAGLLQGCALFFSAPAVEIVDVQVRSLGVTSGTAEVVLEVTNEGRRQMDIRGFLYEIEVRGPDDGEDWISLAEGFQDQEISIPGHEARRVTVPVPFQYSAVGAALRSFLSEGEVPYRLKGEVWMGGSSSGLQLPFRSRGVIKP